MPTVFGADRGDEETLARMLDAIVHRGPDDHGIHTDGGLAIGPRRLSVIDLPGGHQPIANEDGTIVVAVDGELYNYRELRERTAGLRSHA